MPLNIKPEVRTRLKSIIDQFAHFDEREKLMKFFYFSLICAIRAERLVKQFGHIHGLKGFEFLPSGNPTVAKGGVHIIMAPGTPQESRIEGTLVNLEGHNPTFVTAFRIAAHLEFRSTLTNQQEQKALNEYIRAEIYMLDVMREAEAAKKDEKTLKALARRISQDILGLKEGQIIIIHTGYIASKTGHAVYVSYTKRNSGLTIKIHNYGEGSNLHTQKDAQTIYPYLLEHFKLKLLQHIFNLLKARYISNTLADSLNLIYHSGLPAHANQTGGNSAFPLQPSGNCSWYNQSFIPLELVQQETFLALNQHELTFVGVFSQLADQGNFGAITQDMSLDLSPEEEKQLDQIANTTHIKASARKASVTFSFVSAARIGIFYMERFNPPGFYLSRTRQDLFSRIVEGLIAALPVAMSEFGARLIFNYTAKPNFIDKKYRVSLVAALFSFVVSTIFHRGFSKNKDNNSSLIFGLINAIYGALCLLAKSTYEKDLRESLEARSTFIAVTNRLPSM